MVMRIAPPPSNRTVVGPVSGWQVRTSIGDLVHLAVSGELLKGSFSQVRRTTEALPGGTTIADIRFKRVVSGRIWLVHMSLKCHGIHPVADLTGRR
jgi:hypothetical protein